MQWSPVFTEAMRKEPERIKTRTPWMGRTGTGLSLRRPGGAFHSCTTLSFIIYAGTRLILLLAIDIFTKDNLNVAGKYSNYKFQGIYIKPFFGLSVIGHQILSPADFSADRSTKFPA